MKHHFLLLIIFFFNLIPLFSKPPLNALIGFYDWFIQHSLYELCPYRGMIATQGQLTTLSQEKNGSFAMKDLCNLLFHQEADGVFMPTTHAPYSHFTPQTIGLLCAHLYNKTIDDYTTHESLVRNLSKTFEQRTYPKRLHMLLDLINKASVEENLNLYDYGTVYQLLIAFLWQKSSEATEIKDYKVTLEKNLCCLEQPLDSLHHTITVPCDDYLINLGDNFEMLVIKHHHYSGHAEMHPPPLSWHREVRYKKVQKRFSDCCETALRSLINEFLYDPSFLCFDVNRLGNEIITQLPASFMTFYELYKNATDADLLDSPKAHRAWATVISGLPNVEYRKENYEIHPSMSNFIRILSFLFNIPLSHELPFDQQLGHLCTRISEKNCITIKPTLQEVKSDTEALIIFQVQDKQALSPSRTLHLHILPEHAWLKQSGQPKDNNEKKDNLYPSLQRLSEDQKLSLPAQDLLFLYRDTLSLSLV